MPRPPLSVEALPNHQYLGAVGLTRNCTLPCRSLHIFAEQTQFWSKFAAETARVLSHYPDSFERRDSIDHSSGLSPATQYFPANSKKRSESQLGSACLLLSFCRVRSSDGRIVRLALALGSSTWCKRGHGADAGVAAQAPSLIIPSGGKVSQMLPSRRITSSSSGGRLKLWGYPLIPLEWAVLCSVEATERSKL